MICSQQCFELTKKSRNCHTFATIKQKLSQFQKDRTENKVPFEMKLPKEIKFS